MAVFYVSRYYTTSKIFIMLTMTNLQTLYRQISDIMRTKSLNLNVSRLVLQLS